MSESGIAPNTVRKCLRIGVVGASARATLLGSYFTEHPLDGRIVALCDPVKDRAELLNDYYGLQADIFSDVHDMIRHSNGLDVVAITTPDAAHAEPAVAALEAGINVFCEKPMATTLEACDRIIAAARQSSAVFYLGFNLRHGPIHETIHETVSSGRLGKVTTIEANVHYYEGRTYFRRWNRFREYGGGLWLTKACHDFDLLNWMAGAEPQTVYAVASLSHYRPKPDAAEQCRHCSLQYECPDYIDVVTEVDPQTQMGVIKALRQVGERAGQGPPDLCLFNSRKDTFDNGIAVVTYANDIRATFTVNVLAARSTRQMTVIGSDGMLEADLERGTVLVTERHSHRQYEYDARNLIGGGHGGSDAREMADFIHVIHSGNKPKTSWAEGRLAVKVGLAARESADTGQVVHLQP